MPRLPIEERRGAIARMQRLVAGGIPRAKVIADTAASLGISGRAVRRWLDNPERFTNSPEREALKLSDLHLVVMAQEQDRQGAYDRLKAAGELDVHYSTFARAIKRCDSGVVASALNGREGLINGRVYRTLPRGYRNQMWHFDHTKLDVYVLASHRHRQPCRPWVSAIVDSATSLILAIHVALEPPNTERLRALLADASAREEYGDVVVGGIPDSLRCDNAAEHLGDAVQEGCTRLGILFSPTTPYSPWQNGKAERVMGLLNQQVAARLPGSTRGGMTMQNKRRFAPKRVARTSMADQEMDTREVLADDVHIVDLEVLTKLLDAWRRERNATTKITTLGGLTPVQAWNEDPTAITWLDENTMRSSMLRGDQNSYRINGDGIHFRNKIYLAPEMVGIRGSQVQVRWLPQNRDFIEVFDMAGNYLFPADDVATLSQEQAARFAAVRGAQEKAARQIEQAVQAHRNELGDHLNAVLGDGDVTPDEVTIVEALTDVASMTSPDSKVRKPARPDRERNQRPAHGRNTVADDAARAATLDRIERLISQKRNKKEDEQS